MFSVEDPLMTPVMAIRDWSDSTLAWKDSLNALSYIISPQSKWGLMNHL